MTRFYSEISLLFVIFFVKNLYFCKILYQGECGPVMMCVCCINI